LEGVVHEAARGRYAAAAPGAGLRHTRQLAEHVAIDDSRLVFRSVDAGRALPARLAEGLVSDRRHPVVGVRDACLDATRVGQRAQGDVVVRARARETADRVISAVNAFAG